MNNYFYISLIIVILILIIYYNCNEESFGGPHGGGQHGGGPHGGGRGFHGGGFGRRFGGWGGGWNDWSLYGYRRGPTLIRNVPVGDIIVPSIIADYTYTYDTGNGVLESCDLCPNCIICPNCPKCTV